MLYGSDMHRVFHTWWTHAGAEYVPFHDGRPDDKLTLYYDPLIDYHHRVGLGGSLSMTFQIVPQTRDEARLLEPRLRGVIAHLYEVHGRELSLEYLDDKAAQVEAMLVAPDEAFIRGR